MKIKFIALLATLTAVFSGISSAVTVNLAGIANDSVGRITLNGLDASGRAVFVSSTETLTANATSSLTALLNSGNVTSAEFDAAITSLVGTTSPTTDPGVVRTVAFTGGLLTTTGAQEMGTAGNFTYLFLVAEAGGQVSGIGAYSGAAVPPLGAVTFNAGTSADFGVGTSVLNGTSGFQLAAVIPEPSVALLGFASVGLMALRRRRR